MKKIIAVLLVLLLCAQPSMVAAKNLNLGDLDYDGQKDVRDYMKLKCYVLGTYKMSFSGLCKSDLNLDGEVNALDYIILKRYVLGTLPDAFSIDKTVSELTDEELLVYIDAVLGHPYEEGSIYFELEPSLTKEGIRDVLQSLGLPTAFETDETYLSVYNTDEGHLFTIRIAEEAVRDMMLKLYREDAVIFCEPCYEVIVD